MLNSGHFIFFLLLTTTLTTTTALTHPSDISSLKSFKSSITPSSIPSSSCLSTWNFTSDPCSLPRLTHFICGLTCNPSGTHIISISLDSVGYSGTLSPSLSLLKSLTNLDLSHNSFHGQIPFSSLTSLQSLSLTANSFSGSITNSISSLKSLQSLDLSLNHLTGEIPFNAFSSIPNLQSIDLSFNKLRGSVPKLPPKLLQFTLRSNSLSSISQTSFSNSNFLEVIDLSCNSINGSLPSWIFNLPSLQQINFSNNTITHLEIPKPSATLVAVDLGFNRISGYIPVNFAYYPALAALSLRYNKLRGEIPWQFGKQRMLTRLFLDGNYLIGKPPAEFFSGKGGVSFGSLGDNCLEGCPSSSELCLPEQKPVDVCNKVYRGRLN